MTRAESVQAMLHDPRHAQMKQVMRWKYLLECNDYPNDEQLRLYLEAGRGTFDNFWTAELKRRGYGQN